MASQTRNPSVDSEIVRGGAVAFSWVSASGQDQTTNDTDRFTSPGLASGGQYTHYAHAKDFGFSFGASETITSVRATIKARKSASGGATLVLDDVRLVVGGSVTGANGATANVLPSSDGDTVVDFTGLAIPAASVNASTFGLAISVGCSVGGTSRQAEINQVTLEATSAGMVPGPGGGSATGANMGASVVVRPPAAHRMR